MCCLYIYIMYMYVYMYFGRDPMFNGFIKCYLVPSIFIESPKIIRWWMEAILFFNCFFFLILNIFFFHLLFLCIILIEFQCVAHSVVSRSIKHWRVYPLQKMTKKKKKSKDVKWKRKNYEFNADVFLCTL